MEWRNFQIINDILVKHGPRRGQVLIMDAMISCKKMAGVDQGFPALLVQYKGWFQSLTVGQAESLYCYAGQAASLHYRLFRKKSKVRRKNR